jgi:tRNA-binding protein
MEPAPIKDPITIDDLDRIDIRVGTIRAVHDVEGADKLVALTVDLGSETRTVVAGLKQERDDPTEIEGRQALFVVNLPPRRMRGVVSEGMLFDVGYADGLIPCLAMPEREVPDGTRAG